MKDILEKVFQKIRMDEGLCTLEKILLEVYLHKGISTKDLARRILLPVPIATAVKKEMIKAGLLVQDRGIWVTSQGKKFVEEVLGFGGLDRDLYNYFMKADYSQLIDELKDEMETLTTIFDGRPQVDVTLDQSKCTTTTSMKRAILCLKQNFLIGRKILCVGDDDLVSIAIGLLLKKLFPSKGWGNTHIHVIDLDRRFLKYIDETAQLEGIPVTCCHADLRDPIPSDILNRFDCFFTDPPYTLQGIELFVSRGISALKKQIGLPVFLSFAHKSPNFSLNMQRSLIQMGLSIVEVIPHFNEYEGAQMIGGTGQMIVLQTTQTTQPLVEGTFRDALYTGELKKTLRIYRCKSCSERFKVGSKESFVTIELLKASGCPRCRGQIFDLVDKIYYNV